MGTEKERLIRQAGKGFFTDSYYGRRAASCAGIWIFSAALALVCTMITYPGIWYSDSYVRVETGHAVLNAVVKTLTGHGAPLNTHNGFTLIPSFFMALSAGITGHVGLYTFAQAFAFFSASFLLIRELNPFGWKVQIVLFALCPLIYGVSVYYEAGIGCAAGMAALLLLLRRVEDEKSLPDRVLEFLMIAFASLVTFGYRTNALTVMPVLLVILLRVKCPRVRKTMALAALMLGVIMTKAIPWIFQVSGQSNGMTGFVWEMITVIQRMAPEEQAKYADYLDEIGGEGATEKVLKSSTEDSANNFVWGSAINMEKMSAPGMSGVILRKTFGLIREQPAAWLRVKWDFICRTMGMAGRLDYSEYDYNRWENMDKYGFNDSLQRWGFYNSFIRANEVMGIFTCHPWMMFLITGVMMAVETLRKSKKSRLYAQLFWMAVFFYAAFLLINVSFEVRFFYPALWLMMILDGAILLEWIGILVRRLRDAQEPGKGRRA